VRYGWTLDRASWDAFNEVAGSALRSSWQMVRLETRDQDSVPLSSGIYAICANPASTMPMLPPTLNNTVYVGQASRLKVRFLKHCRHPEQDLAAAKACFDYRLQFWFVCADAANVAVLESLLIACLGPSANRVSGVIRAVLGAGEPA